MEIRPLKASAEYCSHKAFIGPYVSPVISSTSGFDNFPVGDVSSLGFAKPAYAEMLEMYRQYPTFGANSSPDIFHVFRDVAGVVYHDIPFAPPQ